jgi:hypothetical protein
LFKEEWHSDDEVVGLCFDESSRGVGGHSDGRSGCSADEVAILFDKKVSGGYKRER